MASASAICPAMAAMYTWSPAWMTVFASGNKTRDDQPNHIRIERRVPREVARLWEHMCPAQVYEIGAEDGDGTVMVELAPSNCVQCGAITAKGGRLTPPEGGSGPEYTVT